MAVNFLLSGLIIDTAAAGWFRTGGHPLSRQGAAIPVWIHGHPVGDVETTEKTAAKNGSLRQPSAGEAEEAGWCGKLHKALHEESTDKCQADGDREWNSVYLPVNIVFLSVQQYQGAAALFFHFPATAADTLI